MKRKFYLLLSAVFLTLSILVLYGEMANFLQIEFSFFNELIVYSQGYIVMNILMMFPFMYFMIVTYFGIFNFTINKFYDLYPKHSDSISLILSASNLMKLVFPITFNFSKVSKISKSQFLIQMQSLNENTIFGKGLNQYVFPCLLIIFFCLNLFNVY